MKRAVILFCTAFLALSLPAFAAEPTIDPAQIVAKVVWSKGGFEAQGDALAQVRKLNKSDPIFQYDKLTTDSAGKAQIVFTDDTLMTFRPGTEFKVSEYKFSAKGKEEGSYIMNLFKGGFRTITGLIAKATPQNYKVVTPTATIGVRGTDYSVYLKPDGELLVARHEGKPCVTDSKEENTLCLDEKTPYASVKEGGVPVPLEQRPPEFDEMGVIENVTFMDGGLTMPGVLSNFCIQ